MSADGSLMTDPLLDGGFMYSGGGMNATFVEDPDTFGRTLQCTSGGGSIVWLAPVPYYATLDDGPVSFTINLWFKAGNTSGGLFQYLFSHMGDPDGSEWGPNQISIYVPEQQHPRYGVVRAVIKDTSNEDDSTSSGQQIYLDSDGLVSDNVNPSVSSNANPMADGNWHMVTISTHADMTTGFDMYLDGAPVGDMLQGNYTGSNGTVAATGGGSMNLTSSITLCQRADVEPQRGFEGRMSSLGIWASVLEPGNITALFKYGLANVPNIGNATNQYLPILVTNEPAPGMMPEAAPAQAPAPALAGKPSVLGCTAI
ncbi:TPA: hypothetical protein ACH3X1_015103 [Trebouxia sp. C0004]